MPRLLTAIALMLAIAVYALGLGLINHGRDVYEPQMRDHR